MIAAEVGLCKHRLLRSSIGCPIIPQPSVFLVLWDWISNGVEHGARDSQQAKKEMMK